jgi:general secretion pathway protein E
MMTEKLQELINNRATIAEFRAQALADGMSPMRQYGYKKAAEGRTTLDEVVTVTSSSE